MKNYIYKKIKEEKDNRSKDCQIPIYVWNEPPDFQYEKKDAPADSDNSEDRGYEEVDFNIDNIIIKM